MVGRSVVSVYYDGFSGSELTLLHVPVDLVLRYPGKPLWDKVGGQTCKLEEKAPPETERTDHLKATESGCINHLST